MVERERRQRPAPKERVDEETDVAVPKSERGEKVKEDIDELLDEIDTVLEDNAEEFIKSYVQKGGE